MTKSFPTLDLLFLTSIYLICPIKSIKSIDIYKIEIPIYQNLHVKPWTKQQSTQEKDGTWFPRRYQTPYWTENSHWYLVHKTGLCHEDIEITGSKQTSIVPLQGVTDFAGTGPVGLFRVARAIRFIRMGKYAPFSVFNEEFISAFEIHNQIKDSKLVEDLLWY